LDATVEYITGNANAWGYSRAGDDDIPEIEWERQLASLDAALLGSVEDLATDESDLPAALDAALKGSLWSRHLTRLKPAHQSALRTVLVERGKTIWRESTANQRRGYYLAGVGFKAGQSLDESADGDLDELLRAEAAIAGGDEDGAVTALLKLHHRLQSLPPFASYSECANSDRVFSGWLSGEPLGDLIAIGGEDANPYVQDAIVYRLAWGLEAIRVRAIANSAERADEVNGSAARAVETGMLNVPAAIMLQLGLASREAALVAAKEGGASFSNRTEMEIWLSSDDMQAVSSDERFPTTDSRWAWVLFLSEESRRRPEGWKVRTKTVDVSWVQPRPPDGTPVRLVQTADGIAVESSAFEHQGWVWSNFRIPPVGSLRATVMGEEVVANYFGPFAEKLG
jgi:hypothetical protein